MGAATARPAPYKVVLKRGDEVMREIPCVTVFEALDVAGEAARVSVGGESVEIVNQANTRQRVWGEGE